MSLVTCPVCLREKVSDTGNCPGCNIPVGDYLEAMPSFRDPAEKDIFVCQECGASFERERKWSCPSCGARLPEDESIISLSIYSCPLCKSPKTERFDWDYNTRPFTHGYWCRNCGNVFKERGGDIVVRSVNRDRILPSDNEGGCLGCAFVVAVVVVVVGVFLTVFL